MKYFNSDNKNHITDHMANKMNCHRLGFNYFSTSANPCGLNQGDYDSHEKFTKC